ncbi:MAG: hypothetical protein WAV09_03280 [Minisyncoccia bacterium]
MDDKEISTWGRVLTAAERARLQENPFADEQKHLHIEIYTRTLCSGLGTTARHDRYRRFVTWVDRHGTDCDACRAVAAIIEANHLLPISNKKKALRKLRHDLRRILEPANGTG